MRNWSLACLLFWLLALPVAAEPEVFPCVFLGIETGDYFHLVVEDTEGIDRRFFVFRDDPSLRPFLENPEAHLGQEIEVLWQTSERDIPEAGGKMTVDEALSIREKGR